MALRSACGYAMMEATGGVLPLTCQGIFGVACAYGEDDTPSLEPFDLLAFMVLCSPDGGGPGPRRGVQRQVGQVV